MPPPESFGTPPSWDNKKISVGDVVSAENPRDVVEVARILAAYGGGTGSFDLALDLLMNEVVEQARLLTGATGAAIALLREGEMVCRATSGKDAPELGVRLETNSGLSGACLQTGTIQQCSDTEADSRVNVEACRQLGLRSILVLPLDIASAGEGKNPFGVFEVFSSQPNAFGERDITTLQFLACRVVENKRGAEETAAFEPSGFDSAFAGSKVMDTLSQPASEFEDAGSEGHEPSRGGEIWTSVLGVLVVVIAVLLGLALGWHRAATSGPRARQNTANAAASASGASKTQSPNDFGSAAGATPARNTASPEPASDGLVVTQNGKVIYRVPEPKAASKGGGKSGNASANRSLDNRLIHRVEPVYPEEARARHIQGVVGVEVQIGADGAVDNITVVEGEPELADAAVQAVRQWRYRPYTVDGKAVGMQTRVTIRFTLPAS
jgi:TonB family protein